MNLAYENVKEVDCLDISREGCDAWEAAVRRYEDRIGKLQLNALFGLGLDCPLVECPHQSESELGISSIGIRGVGP